jgi:hypothetical protein
VPQGHQKKKLLQCEKTIEAGTMILSLEKYLPLPDLLMLMGA